MVLSNKKLKQKLRAEIAKSASKTSISTISDSNPQNYPQSLKHLLSSSTQKPQLSKREKRRKTPNLCCPKVETVKKEVAHVEETEDGKIKKRKIEKNVENKVAHVEETEYVGKKKRKRDKKEKGDEKDGGVDGELGRKDEEGGELNKGRRVSSEKNKKLKKKKKRKLYRTKKKLRKQLEAEKSVISEQNVVQHVDDNNSLENTGDKRKVYVGGIPYYSTEDDIQSYFDHCGTITDIDCMTFPDSGKFRGIAIISFKTEEAAKRALALDGSDMGGLYLICKPHKVTQTAKVKSDFSPSVLAGYNRIYVGNLSWDVTEDDLRKLFVDCNISTIRFGEDKESLEFKGYAHVDFTDGASLTKALKLDQTVVCERPVKIRCAVPPKNGTIVDSAPVSTVVKTETVDNKAETQNIINEVSLTQNINRGTSTQNINGGTSAQNTNGLSSTQNVSGVGSTQNVSGVSTTQNVSVVSAGKLKRRTCYDCGERGHISSDCPKKNTMDKETQVLGS